MVAADAPVDAAKAQAMAAWITEKAAGQQAAVVRSVCYSRLEDSSAEVEGLEEAGAGLREVRREGRKLKFVVGRFDPSRDSAVQTREAACSSVDGSSWTTASSLQNFATAWVTWAAGDAALSRECRVERTTDSRVRCGRIPHPPSTPSLVVPTSQCSSRPPALSLCAVV